MLLLTPFSKYGLDLKNRVVMTAMSRYFADKKHNPTPDMLAYYQRRAADGVGLILTEGAIIHPMADGYPNTPYIYTKEQIESWKRIVEAVHGHGAKIFCQLWHCGRISHPDFLHGSLPVSASAIAPEGLHTRLNKPFVTPLALPREAVPEIIEMFVQATKNALAAGFDGVEIHGGHGYLIDSFFDARLNTRTDEYGGSIENRCRFAIEITKAVLNVAGPICTSLRISPSREMNGVYDWPDLKQMIVYLILQLDKLGLRILDISCARSDYFKTSARIIPMIRSLWPHIIIAGASLPLEKAEEALSVGLIDLVTYGRLILANPDFIKKITAGEPLTAYNPAMLKTLY